MAEQNFNQAIRIADRGYIIVHGEIVVAAASVDDLRGNASSSGSISAGSRERGGGGRGGHRGFLNHSRGRRLGETGQGSTGMTVRP
jgi:hypothetical protein